MYNKIQQFIYKHESIPFKLLINLSTKYLISIEFIQNDTILEYNSTTDSMQEQIHNGLAHEIVQQLNEYIVNSSYTFDLPLSITGTEFQKSVWLQIAQIKSGYTSSYKEIAWQINSSPRAVANACGANKFAIIVPCHRVVASNNKLGGFIRGTSISALEIKQWLLTHEKVTA